MTDTRNNMLYTPVSQFPVPEDGIWTLPRSCTLRDAIKKLCSTGISSAPVVSTDSPQLKFEGFMDFSAIAVYVVFGFRTLRVEDDDTFTAMLHRELFKHKTVGDIALSDDSCVALSPDDTFLDAMKVMDTFKFHRVAVLDKMGNLVNVITQSKLCGEILKDYDKNLGYNEDILESTINALGMLDTTRPVVTVSMSDGFLRPFELMMEHRITGVGVVDDHGRLVGNVSAHDVSALVEYKTVFQKVHRSELTVGQFMETVTMSQGVLCARMNEQLGSVICTMLQHQVHRLYVVDESEAPVGVVSYTDVISQLLPDMPAYAEKQEGDKEDGASDDGDGMAYYDRFFRRWGSVLPPGVVGGETNRGTNAASAAADRTAGEKGDEDEEKGEEDNDDEEDMLDEEGTADDDDAAVGGDEGGGDSNWSTADNERGGGGGGDDEEDEPKKEQECDDEVDYNYVVPVDQ